MRTLRKRVLAALAVVAVTAAGAVATRPAQAAVQPPNIVFVLTDDLSWNLVQYMPAVLKLQADGTTFSNYVVTDSLCCPSRSSIFTGKFPHDTGVFTNEAPDGGFGVFHARDETDTFATQLKARGYATAMMGKYLNGYLPGDTQGGTSPYVPPGWSEWDVAGNGYGEYNYNLNENHTVVHYGSQPADYLTNVVSAKGRTFIQQQAAAHKPFLLEIATFAPHGPFTPADQDLNKFPGLTAPRGPAYDTLPTAAPTWLAANTPITADEQATIDTSYRKRAQAVQSVDRMLTALRNTLISSGVADNTYVVFSSDNGFHLGEHRLTMGKQTAFDTDINVPLVIAGPQVVAGTTRPEAVQNVDLNPTFQRWAGGTPGTAVDGRSLTTLADGTGDGSGWRTASLIEHHKTPAAQQVDDPDAQTVRNGMPTTYNAMRTNTYTYVEYANGEREYYDRVADPDELHNIAGSLTAARLAALHTALAGIVGCHTHDTCWTAGHVNP